MNRQIPMRLRMFMALFLGSAVGDGLLLPPAYGQTVPRPSRATAKLKAWRPLGHIDDPAVTECSGIVASRKYPGIFWVHNDSGHQAVLYAIRGTGEVVAEVPVAGGKNIDWEDIATDDRGFLYIADSGNNFGMFPIRSIYQVTEPDPFAEPVQPAQVVKRFKYAYTGKRFDAEGLFVREGTFWIISKPRGSRGAIYRLEPGQKGKLRPVQVAPLPLTGVTAADLSPDGKTLVVGTSYSVTVFAVNSDGIPTDPATAVTVRFPSGDVEGCCFDGNDVMVTSEPGSVYRIPAADLAAGTRFVHPKQLPPG
ncbi:MAG: hypothetical protein ACE5GE_07545 [Phycisphaerae bacterium]